jgi:hypothetical protein
MNVNDYFDSPLNIDGYIVMHQYLIPKSGRGAKGNIALPPVLTTNREMDNRLSTRDIRQPNGLAA